MKTMMKRIFRAVILLFLTSGILLPMCAQVPDARSIMQRSIDVAKVPGMEAVTELRIVDARGRERVRKVAMVSRDEGAVEKRLIRFLEPADVKGTGLLVFDYPDKDDEMWLYLPAIRKVRKIVSSDKGKSFMGSEFSNADMAAPNLDDFRLSYVGEGTADGVPCYRITMIPKDDRVAREYGFSKKEVWIGKKDMVMRKAIYYNDFGEVEKVLTATAVQPVDPERKKLLARKMTMVNEQNGRKSYFRILEVRYAPDVKDEYFTLSYLRQ